MFMYMHIHVCVRELSREESKSQMLKLKFNSLIIRYWYGMVCVCMCIYSYISYVLCVLKSIAGFTVVYALYRYVSSKVTRYLLCMILYGIAFLFASSLTLVTPQCVWANGWMGGWVSGSVDGLLGS